MDLERQLILTKDNITVNIDTCVYYRIVDAKLANYIVSSVMTSVAEVTYATLRTICGENTLQDLLEKRQEISDTIEDYVYEKVNRWGTLSQIFQEFTSNRSSSRICNSAGISKAICP